MEAQRSRGAGEGARVKLESRTPSLGVRELQNWEPDREASSLRGPPSLCRGQQGRSEGLSGGSDLHYSCRSPKCN